VATDGSQRSSFSASSDEAADGEDSKQSPKQTLSDRLRAARERLKTASPQVHGLLHEDNFAFAGAVKAEDLSPCVLLVSCKEGTGIAEARKALLQCISSLPQIGTTIPRSYFPS